MVSISNIFVHWNDEIFPDPHAFKPERWLGKDEESLDMWLVSFSKGPRSCLGTKYVIWFPPTLSYTACNHPFLVPYILSNYLYVDMPILLLFMMSN